ncbi:MAG: preprotein translocase subunit SecA [Methylobacter sp.]
MSDIRALIAGRAIEVSDGCYVERVDLHESELEERLRGLMAHFSSSGTAKAKRFVQKVNALESTIWKHQDDGLRAELATVGRELQKKGFRDDLLVTAFAVIREASRRILGMRHHDVQLMAGRFLLQGKIAEMSTGEGKTLAATLAICTAAATGASVHVVTVNDYLAERDAEKNEPLFSFFGFSLGVVIQDTALDMRREQYANDIVYVSNKELTFDYLKDRIAAGGVLHSHLKLRRLENSRSAPALLLSGLHVAIVDEADSVLIDEARTPLIISETVPDDIDETVYVQAIALAQQLKRDVDFVQSKDRDIWLTATGNQMLKGFTEDLDGLWKSALWSRDLIQKALSALYLFQRDQHYIIAENKVQIVDEFTGRAMPDRTWERGLHQMIEVKEGCEISGQRKTLSQITYQRFFGRYLLLAGMTGTAKEVEPELKRVYDISVAKVPTHKASRRKRLPDRVFTTSEARWRHVAVRTSELAAMGRAVLVGTRSVEGSEYLGRLLADMGLVHTVLNARQDDIEAEAVVQAGLPGKVTVATNMAGRGTDIKLSDEVAETGGLHVILTEFHESARVDRQLFGRAARQGDPGTVEAIVSLEDELFVRYAPLITRIVVRSILPNIRFIQENLFRLLVLYAQTKAERYARKIRLDTIRRDKKWLQALGFIGLDKK